MTLETPRTACVNMAPVPVNMAVCAIQHRPVQKRGFRRIRVGFSLPGAVRTVKEYARYEKWPAAQKNHKKTAKITKNRQKSPIIKLVTKRNIFMRMSAIKLISVLNERDCQMAWVFAHWGPFCRERRAWQNGADSPHFHVHRRKNSQFFKMRVFRRTKVGFGVGGAHNTAGDLQNTPGTPRDRPYIFR